MAAFEPERCYACKKLFCCVDCCVNHIKNKHPGPISQCSLCRYEPLIVRNFEYEPLLCHVVFNHLPLYCRACGKIFHNVEDLKSIGKCTQNPIIKIELPTFTESVKLISTANTPSSFNQTSYKSLTNRTGVSIGSDDNWNFSQFTSPPQLTRNTIPKIIFTPSVLSNNESEKTNVSNALSNLNLNDTESIYYSLRSSVKSDLLNTPSTSILPISSSSDIEIQQQLSLKDIYDKNLMSMEELEGTEIDIELTDVHGKIYTDKNTSLTTENISVQQQLTNSGKCQRLNNQFEETSKNAFDISETEEFFEAQQSFAETSIGIVENADIRNTITEMIGEKKYSEKQTIYKNSIKTENHLPMKNNCSKSEFTSRIVMMVLMEQTNNGQLLNFTPLIDSSLKKLESILSKYSSIEQNTSQCKDKFESMEKISIASIDTCTSVSTVECLSKQKNPLNIPNISFTGTGIFSAVANVIKNAFKNLSGATSTKIPFEKSTSSKGISNSTMDSTSRPSKRSRDDVELTSFETPKSPKKHENRYEEQSDIRSPLQKRLCRSYKHIHGREPIARMKKLISSPRGISSERQCFQQGSLTVGDTIIPLPSRAHIYTNRVNSFNHFINVRDSHLLIINFILMVSLILVLFIYYILYLI